MHKTIKGLTKKDLYNLSNYKVTLIIIIIFCGIAIIGTSAIEYGPIIICAMFGMISLSTFSYDEIAKSNKYILTLPTNKKEIIKSKYIFSIVCAIIGAIIGFILTVIITNILNYVRPEKIINIDYNKLIITTIGGLWGISLIQSIQIPSIYKWGAEKGRIQMFILVFALVVIISGAMFLLIKANININLAAIEQFFNTYGIGILLISIVIMHYISYKISFKIYSNTEE